MQKYSRIGIFVLSFTQKYNAGRNQDNKLHVTARADTARGIRRPSLPLQMADELHPGRVERRLRTMLKAGFHDCGEITGTADTGIPEVLPETARQLNEYFNGHRRAFDLPLLPVGSDFQKRVWQQLLHIPYGTTVSYGELAAAIGSPDSVRRWPMPTEPTPSR